MNHLNLNLLKALAVLLQERHVTRSAERLCLTQSAMSRQLAALRSHFDDALLVREGNDYLLTARARQLRPQLEDILGRIDQLQQLPAFDPTDCQRRFCFACTDYVAQFILPELLRCLQREAPGVDLEYRMWQPQWLDHLGTLSVDLASTMGEVFPSGIHTLPLGSDQPVCLMSADHPLLTAEITALVQLTAYPFVQVSSGGDKDSFFDRVLTEAGLQRRILLSVPFFSAAFSALAQSEMLLIVPAHIARQAAKLYPLQALPVPLAGLELPDHHYHLLWHSIHEHDPAHRWVREKMAKVIRQSIYSP
ncbi:MAG: LysR family transcriptional regulator [Marinobacterium sp.]|nr:LysR family transcriptional regulator [Marinobacterium sp.]